MKVFKYRVPYRSTFELSLPEGAQILHFALQGSGEGDLCIWSLVDSEAPLTDRFFHLAGTGHDMSVPPGSQLEHLGTALISGVLVIHLFEYVPGQTINNVYTPSLGIPLREGSSRDTAKSAHNA